VLKKDTATFCFIFYILSCARFVWKCEKHCRW